jgi:glucose/arabinose dehydrogenase
MVRRHRCADEGGGRSNGCLVAALAILIACLASSASASTLISGFSDAVVASGISNATAMAIAPDGRIFVCQQTGQLRVIKNGSLLATPFVTVNTTASGERGLLGVAFHPDFPATPHVFVYYTVPTAPIHNRLSRFTASGDTAVAGSQVVLADFETLSSAQNHNGGAIHFGLDGKLYVAVGENANPSNAQTLGNRLGKILRYNADGTIPTDNPFFNTATGVNRAIWALGLRNPFTFAFDPASGRLFINDVGQNTWEEINEGAPGANYGWPTCEGDCNPPRASFTDPLYAYSHQQGCAIAGGAFYRPPEPQFPPEFVGSYFFADLCGGWIRRLDPANGNTVSGFGSRFANIVDLQVGPDGLLYYLDRGMGKVGSIQFENAPSITQNPHNRTVLAGETATFGVGASGASPLGYQWKRNGSPIANATQPTYTTPPATTADNGATFRAQVSNSFGSTESNPATLTVTSNTPPMPMITSPTSGSRYRAGRRLSFSGTATDKESGVLAKKAFSWTIVFHHDDHTHPFAGPIDDVKSGSVAIPDSGETSTNVFYRVHLTVTDSAGAQATTFVDVRPRVVNLTLASRPAGLQLTLDGKPVTAPTTFGSVVGMRRTIGAPSPQTLAGTAVGFKLWSDGGAQTHQIIAPDTKTTYRARFRP